jgi:hypothetical protein
MFQAISANMAVEVSRAEKMAKVLVHEMILRGWFMTNRYGSGKSNNTSQ